MAIDRILVAIDFSEQSEDALALATSVATRTGGSLVLLWVDDRSSATSAVYGSAIEEVEQLIEEQHRSSATRLRELADRVAAQGIAVSQRIEQGHPDESILRVARDMTADLVVTGTKGRTGFQHFFLGSVAEKVVRMSTTNVLVARGLSGGRLRRILVPTDFSRASEKALRLATELAEPGAEIDLFHAWQYPPGTHGVFTATPRSGPLSDLRDHIVTENARDGSALSERYSAPDRVVRFVQDHGAAAASIQEQLDKVPYDLIAMGTHGYRGFRRFLLGSVAEATVRHATCSVLVAHAAPGEGEEEAD